MNLSTTSAFYASRRGGPQFRGWDAERYALVSLVNEMRGSNYMFQLANSRPNSRKPKYPEPFPTPEEPRKKGADTSDPRSFAAVAARLLGAQRRKASEWQEPAAQK